MSWPSVLGRLFRGRSVPPNVVWICADDYAPAVSGTYGSRIARTPNLDRLAASGVRFDKAYCACPLSTPSRMSFMTGRYPHAVGVTLTPTPLPRHEVTIGYLMRAAGYDTFACGKTHYYDRLSRNFDRCVDMPQHEAYINTRQHRPPPSGVELLGPWRPGYDPASVWLNARCLPYAHDAEVPDTFFTDQAVEYLSEPRQKPFFLWLGYFVTHSPFRFLIDFRQTFDPCDFSVPEVTQSDELEIPKVFHGLTNQDKQGIIAAYHTSVAYLDRNVGRILDALERTGQIDDTLIIFNSDHGYLLGEHGRFEKHCCYEEAVRTALIMSLPGVIPSGKAEPSLVELIDVVPTLLELCGLTRPSNLQGRSLLPLLRDDTTKHREHVISVYPDNAEIMVRTERWKLIYTAGNRRRMDGYANETAPTRPRARLFDLAQDPSEVHDVADLAENQLIVGRLINIAVDHLMETSGQAITVDEPDDPLAILAEMLPPAELRVAKQRS